MRRYCQLKPPLLWLGRDAVTVQPVFCGGCCVVALGTTAAGRAATPPIIIGIPPIAVGATYVGML